MAFEEEFGIEIPDDAAEKIQTVDDAIELHQEQRQVLIVAPATGKDESMRRVVVTGMGMVTPLGDGVDTNWRRLLAAESGIRAIQAFDASDLPTKIAGEVPQGDKANGHFNADQLRRAQGPAQARRLHRLRHRRRRAGGRGFGLEADRRGRAATAPA